MYDKVLFIDFDGTITAEETLNGAMKMCLPEDTYMSGAKKLKSGEWKLKEAVSYAFENIDPSRLPDIMDYVRSIPVRKGFGRLLDRMKDMGIPVVVISGGLRPYVEEKLEAFKDRIADIYSLDIDASGSGIKLLAPYEGETDLIEKTEIMKKYSYKKAICVGDGLTDINMALSADTVFARDTLAAVMTAKNLPFIPWHDFDDVREQIVEICK